MKQQSMVQSSECVYQQDMPSITKILDLLEASVYHSNSVLDLRGQFPSVSGPSLSIIYHLNAASCTHAVVLNFRLDHTKRETISAPAAAADASSQAENYTAPR